MPSAKKPLNPLGIALTKLLEARRMTDTDFAKKTGVSKSLISLIKHRQPSRLPKAVDIDRWAMLLGLSDAERAELTKAAELAWSPAGIQALFAKMTTRNKK